MYDVSGQILHSDTIQSAVFACNLQLGRTPEEALEILKGVRLSSGFPFYKGELFFPKPFSRIPMIQNVSESRQAKTLKKIQFLGKGIFENVLKGDATPISKGFLSESGKFVTDNQDILKQSVKDGGWLDQIIQSKVSQRVSISLDDDPVPFYTDRIFFGPEAGFYFLALFDNDKVRDYFIQGLRLLGDHGIGTDRTVGNGQFSVDDEMPELIMDFPDHFTHVMNLSLYCPDESDVQDLFTNSCSYQLTLRGGYVASPERMEHSSLRKRSVYMVQEGAIFPSGSWAGKVLDLRPEGTGIDHPVWRDGRALFVPINPIISHE